MQAIRRKEVFSRPVTRCMEYIENHLQEPLTVCLLSENRELSESHISARAPYGVHAEVKIYLKNLPGYAISGTGKSPGLFK